MSRPLAVPVGDPGGVGPRVSLTASCALIQEGPIVLFGDAAQLEREAEARGLRDRIERVAPGRVPSRGRVGLVDMGAVSEDAIGAHAPGPITGAAQLRALAAATDAVLAGRARALVTAPVSKEAIAAAGHAFIGQTEYLAQRAQLADDDVTMMFLGPTLRVALVTTHLALVDVPAAITEARVLRAITHLTEALSRLSDTPPRIAVSGLNPHAGEGGLFGDEEARVLRGAIAEAASMLGARAHVHGPVPAEAVFRAAQAGSVDGVVAMFHDQATIASKLLDWGSAVNVTWGLPFVRTSVDHGVAYDAARAGTAADDGMRAALALALRLTQASP